MMHGRIPKAAEARAPDSLQSMWDAWAEESGISLHPGAVRICVDSPPAFPSRYISLDRFEHLHDDDGRRAKVGYSPRLYPSLVNDSIEGWVFRWSSDDVAHGFADGVSGRCDGEHLLEFIAPVAVDSSVAGVDVTVRFT